MSSASSSHDRVNLFRLLNRLETFSSSRSLEGKSYWDIRKLNEDAKYARDLLDRVIRSEGDGTDSSIYDSFETKLNKISMSLILAQSTTPPISPIPTYSLPPPPSSSSSAAARASSASTSSTSASFRTASLLSNATRKNSLSNPTSMLSQPNAVMPSSPPVASPEIIEKEQQESHLFPSHSSSGLPSGTELNPDQEVKNMRDELLGGSWDRLGYGSEKKDAAETDGGARAVVGQGTVSGSSSKIQDELTEQLAQMAAQLRKNAVHFSTSLEAEKPLLEQGAALLESNFSKLTGSQTRLGQVSTKGRSNTWLVLGACLVVCLAWVWMFVIIRLT
ncbi:Vesicle transport protein, Use1 [Phaffia rhodozyma]|uniref:Vesicle transport protein, Use1 n=1 Tax=Phaffia rhodozyma TaxID=264483 RepID=A0A0F7SGU6_PHARH|nr:Vesicle transport protein, Use1 [Phaffia rhodozyma]